MDVSWCIAPVAGPQPERATPAWANAGNTEVGAIAWQSARGRAWRAGSTKLNAGEPGEPFQRCAVRERNLPAAHEHVECGKGSQIPRQAFRFHTEVSRLSAIDRSVYRGFPSRYNLWSVCQDVLHHRKSCREDRHDHAE